MPSKRRKPIYNGPHSEFHDLFWDNLYARIGEDSIEASKQVPIGRAIAVALEQVKFVEAKGRK